MKGTLRTLKDIYNNEYVGIPVEENPELASAVAIEVEKFKKLKSNSEFMIQMQQTRDKGHRHITVFNPMECKKDPGLLNTVGQFVMDIELLGLGSINTEKDGELLETYYIVAESDSIQKARELVGLKPKDLHVTVGFSHKDLFHRPKTSDTLLRDV